MLLQYLFKSKMKKRVSIIKMFFDNPDDFIITIETNNGEIVATAKKKEIKEDE